jgi:hypothetical protein
VNSNDLLSDALVQARQVQQIGHVTAKVRSIAQKHDGELIYLRLIRA